MASILFISSDWLTKLELREMFSDHTVQILEYSSDLLDQIFASDCELIAMEWRMDNETPIHFCERYRKAQGMLPILFLSTRIDILSKEAAFEAGADDFLPIPCRVPELGMRISALLRRSPYYRPDVMRFGNVTLDTYRREVKVGKEKLQIYPKDFAVFEVLMASNSGHLTAEDIFARVWATDSSATVVTVRQCIMRIRKLLAQANATVEIANVHGVGYRLKGEPYIENYGLSAGFGVPGLISPVF